MSIKPKKLEKKSTIGIISPSSPAAFLFKGRFDRGVKFLQEIGFKIKLGNCVTKKFGYMAGTAQERADDINSMFLDKEVAAIFTTIGGYNSNQLLNLIDYDAIKKNPKIFMGYSDTTALLLAINTKTDLVTFHGPAIMSQFGEFPKAFDYTVDNMKRVLCSTDLETKILSSKMWTYMHPDWSKYDKVPRELFKNEGCKVLRSGDAKGKLIGGNLQTIEVLIATEYLPSFKNSIFFWEETEASTAEIDRTLTHLKHAGILNEINGMIVGKLDSDIKISDKDYDLSKIILENTKEYDFPIMIDMNFGHTDPIFTLPIGVKSEIITSEKSLILKESAVV